MSMLRCTTNHVSVTTAKPAKTPLYGEKGSRLYEDETPRTPRAAVGKATQPASLLAPLAA
eukprot:1329628-Pleurochrysis_carterae.AAC.1